MPQEYPRRTHVPRLRRQVHRRAPIVVAGAQQRTANAAMVAIIAKTATFARSADGGGVV